MKENKLKVSFFVQAKRTDKKGLVLVSSECVCPQYPTLVASESLVALVDSRVWKPPDNLFASSWCNGSTFTADTKL